MKKIKKNKTRSRVKQDIHLPGDIDEVCSICLDTTEDIVSNCCMNLCKKCVEDYCTTYETNICGTCIKELPFLNVRYDRTYMKRITKSCKQVLKGHYENGGMWFEPSLENMLNIVNCQDDIYDDLEYYVNEESYFLLFLNMNIQNHMLNKIFIREMM